MNLVRDILDKQLRDREQAPIGKVDGIVLELREDEPPRVASLELGIPTLAWRLHRRLGRWFEERARRRRSRASQRVRIAWSEVRDIGVDIGVAVDGEQSGALAGEAWLRDHVIGRIPGAG